MGDWRDIYTNGWVLHKYWHDVTIHRPLSCQHFISHHFLLFLHPQGLKCSRTLPWCCTSWWRSLTDPIPQRLFWRTQVPLGGSAVPTSQPATHREVLTHSGPLNQDSPTLFRVSGSLIPIQEPPPPPWASEDYQSMHIIPATDLHPGSLACKTEVKEKPGRVSVWNSLTLLKRVSHRSAQSCS